MEPYIFVGAALLIDAGVTGSQETVTVTAVTATTFTATFANPHLINFTISAANSISAANVAPISAGNLTITALQIGSPRDVIQTNATAINATASDGGVYLSNDISNTLTLTAAAVGTASGLTANNIEIYSLGKIVLQQQTTALTQLGTSVPVALFSPGGALTLIAGATLNADGTNPSSGTGKNISSTTPLALATSTINTTTGGVATVKLTAGFSGAGYETAPTVSFSGGGGNGATASATMSVTGLAITNSGSGYANGTLPLTFSGGGGTGAAGTATITNGKVASVSIAIGGSGYTSAPTWTVSGGGGTGAAGTATLSVNAFAITNAGTGYSSAPTVIISPPLGDDIYTGTYDINGTTTGHITTSSPNYLQALVIKSGTAEVTPPGQGNSAIPALITLADLTALAAQTGGNGNVPVINGLETVATTSGGITTVTIVAAAITIDNLGKNGSAGTAVIPGGWSLILDATDGNIVFLNLGDTIKTTGPGTMATGNPTTAVAALTATGQQSVMPVNMEPYIFVGAPLLIDAGQADQETVTVTAVTLTTFTATFANLHAANFTIGTATTANSITVEAGTSSTDVAALGNLTTGGSSIIVSAGGNIAIGTLTAGIPGFPASFGTISVTSTFGGILLNNGTTPNATASKMTLTEATQPVSSAQSAALAELNAIEVIAAADAASANAVAAADAAGAGSRGTDHGQCPPGCIDFHAGRGDDRKSNLSRCPAASR